MVIKTLKEGKKPHLRSISIMTKGDDFTYGCDPEYAYRQIKNLGYFDYKEKIDYDIAEKLLNAFGVEEQMKKLITERNLKPYLDRHHVSLKYPYLNAETEEDMGDLLNF